MLAKDFVKKLEASSPTAEDYKKIGLSAAEAKSFLKSATCTKREKPLDIEGANEVLELLRQWDVSKLEIGMVQFAKKPKIYQKRAMQIGTVEADPLLISDAGEVLVAEAGSTENVLWRAAKTPGAFLAALVIAARFLNDRMLEVISYDDTKAAKRAAKECAAAAGGAKYAAFYQMLLD